MKISLFLILYLMQRINCTINDNIVKYLDNQATIVREKLIRHTRQEENFYNVKFNHMYNMKLIGNYSDGEIFTIFNNSYVIVDQDLYKISQNNYSALDIFLPKEKITLLKATEYKDLGFLLLVTKTGVLHVFGFNNQTQNIFKIQNIIHQNISDATFFKNGNSLYMIVSNYESKHPTFTVIYKFVNSHFDQVSKITTRAAVKVYTFPSNGSEIIVILQDFEWTTLVYKFKNEDIIKIQQVDTINPRQILSYFYDKKRYLMIFDENSIKQFLWTRSELLLLEEFRIDISTEKKEILYADNSPYIIVSKKDSFLVYTLINNQFKLIYNSGYDNITQILNYKIWSQSKNSNNLLILSTDPNNNNVQITSALVTIKVDLLTQEVAEEEEEKLPNCFLNLEKTIYKLRNRLNIAENETGLMLREANNNFEDKSLETKLEELEIKYNTVKSTVEDYLSNKETWIINETTILKNPVEAKKISVTDLHVQNLNNKKWEPQQWLSYSKPQKISGLVRAQLVQTENLETEQNDTLFNDLLLASGNQIISGSVSVQNVEGTNIETNSINDIPMENLFYKSKPVVIRGVKQFPKLNAKNLETGKINEVKGSEMVTFLTNPKLSKYVFDRNLKIDNLWVKNMNEIDFENFKRSVFRRGFTDTIEGNLTFTNIEAKNMSFSSLAHKTEFLTTSTDQIINSSIKFSKIFAKNINTNTLNGIDFTKSVATFDGSVIDGPVSIKDVKVKNNLEMRGTVDKRFLTMSSNKTHIIGTSESDLLQRYNQKVKIKGNLILKNLNLGSSTQMIVNETGFNPKIDEFWTRTTQQIIPVHFEAKNGMLTPHLFATFINGFDFDDYMLNSSEVKKSTKFYFEDATVTGDVILDPNEEHTPDLQKIQEESVKVNGTFTITGRKAYLNILKIDKLQVEKLNGVDVTNMVNEVEVSGLKKIQNLVIQGNLHCKNLAVDTINNISLNTFLENSLYIDQPEDLNELNFDKVSAKNLYVTSSLNDHHIDELAAKMEKIKFFNKIENLHLDGNITIDDIHNLATINNFDLNTLLRDGMSKIEDNIIYGSVKFMGDVKIRDLYLTIANDVDFPTLTKRILYKFWNQTITKPFKFTTLKTTSLITDKINEIYVGNLIDVTSTESQTLFVPNGLRLVEPTEILNLTSEFECNLDEALQNLKSPLPQFWDTITVKSNTTFLDKESAISQIFEKVVTNDGDHLITGQVTFVNHICAKNITTLGRVNGINIFDILNDAVLNDQKIEQIVSGRKTFINLVAEDVKILQNVHVSKINDYEVFGISDNIIDKNSHSEPIKGKKILFGGLQAKKIETAMIGGIKPEDLVSFHNSNKVPRAIFDSINVDNNFNVQFVNNMAFDEFLNDRLLKFSDVQTITGSVFFQNININGNVLTSQINDIKMENIVYDDGIQSIESGKKFLEDLNIVGNVTIDFLNGFKISEAYEKAVIRNEDASFNRNVRILRPIQIYGNVTTNYINNFPISDMLDIRAKHSLLQTEANQINEITEKISNFVIKYLNTTIRMPTEYLYLEKSTNLQISIRNTIAAQIVETKDVILIHLESEENGNFCGLPKTCKCPVQQTMQISSENSISSLINKGSQRIYSYSDDDIMIHLITNSISTSNLCRTNKTKVINEVSSLTWNTISTDNTTGGFFVHRTFFTGYVSGVKFFTSYGKTYAVIGFYYDPVVDTHAMNCLVLRFNEDKTAVEEIQKIPSVGVKTISLFPTAQGVILIIGNEKEDTGNVTTQIFRFNRYKELFELLREVPAFGSLFAVGVVLEMDNLIILANRHSVLHILKYQEKFDNYYFYQSFQLDYPVSSLSVFYAEGFGISDAYLSVVTKNNKYFIYSFQFIEGWKLESVGELQGIKSLIPFKLNGNSYLFAPSSKISSLLTLVEHDSG